MLCEQCTLTLHTEREPAQLALNRTCMYSSEAGRQVLCKPGTVKPHAKFEAEIYALNKDEGGRHKPFFSNYKPQFYFRTADITGAPRYITPNPNLTLATTSPSSPTTRRSSTSGPPTSPVPPTPPGRSLCRQTQ